MKWPGLWMLALIGFSCATPTTQEFPPRPNILLIQADDLGYNDLGVHGNQLVETPFLDSLAQESLQFSQFYVNPVCAASRASLLTGRQFLKTGVSHVHGGKDYMHLSEVTLADVLSDAGYATGIWGKWHVGKTQGYLPGDRGFEEAFVSDLYRHRDASGRFNGRQVTHQRWSDEVLVDYAIDFIGRTEDRPFFAYVSSMTCHGSLDAPQELVQKYRDTGLEKGLATLYAMVEKMDREIGRLIRYLDESGKRENTVIFFLSDNGPAINRREFSDDDRVTRKVQPYKGFKGNIWENGVKSPLFVSWPGVVSPGIDSSLTDITDLFPTIALRAGAYFDHVVDGVPIASLSGGNDGSIKYSFNYAHRAWQPSDQPWTPEGVKGEYRPMDAKSLQFGDQVVSVRHGDHKLLLNAATNMNPEVAGLPWSLFNVAEDPYETNNLIGQGLSEEEHLKTVLTEWFEDDIRRADHPFAMPLHIIGGDTNLVYAVGAQSISPSVIPTFNWLSQWQDAGALASYALSVEEAGDYQVDIYHSEASGVDFSIKLAAGQYPIAFSGQMTSLMVRNIPSGNVTLSLQKSDEVGAVARIHRLEFIRH